MAFMRVMKLVEGCLRTLLSTPSVSKFSGLLSSLIAAGIALFLLTLACSRPDAFGPAAGSAENSPLLVAAAADLAGIQQPLADSFEKATGRKASIVFGSSGLLARQIEQGAPYDVYLSANEGYVQSLVSAGKLDPRTVTVYALGRLGLWSRGGEVRDLRDLTGRRVTRIAIANPAHAPYGVAARQALQNAGLWDELRGKIVYGENVRQALQFAESGNADVALTAWSLVFDRGGVLVGDNLHAPIRQTAAVVRTTTRPELAARFLEFLTGRAGGRILQTHGFKLPAPANAPAR